MEKKDRVPMKCHVNQIMRGLVYEIARLNQQMKRPIHENGHVNQLTRILSCESALLNRVIRRLIYEFVHLTYSLIHYFETIPNSQKLKTTTKMWLLKDFKIQIA